MYYLLNYKYKGFDKYWRRFMMNFSGDALHLLQTRENYVLIYMYTLFASCSTGGLTKWHMVVVCWLVLWTSSLIFYFQNSSFLNYLLASAPEHWTCNLFTHLRSLCSNLNKWASSRLSFNYAYETESLRTHCKYSFIHCKYLLACSFESRFETFWSRFLQLTHFHIKSL